MSKIIIGVDISKQKFDAALVLGESHKRKYQTKTFDNTPEGFKEFVAWCKEVKGDTYHAVMEATGRYGEDLAHFLYAFGCDVSVVNPAQINYYSKSLLRRAKTDKVDSKLIAEFACNQTLSLWKPLSENMCAFKEIVRCIEDFKADKTQTGNRLEASKDLTVKETLKKRVTHIEEQIETLQQELKNLSEKDFVIAKTISLLVSIPGIGETTAWNLLAELPDLKTFENAKQLAAFAGLNPSIRTSGTSVKGRGGLSRIGSKTLRKALYFPALSLMRSTKIKTSFNSLTERLRKKGKKGMIIVGAVMHKLIRTIFCVLKKQEFFQE